MKNDKLTVALKLLATALIVTILIIASISNANAIIKNSDNCIVLNQSKVEFMIEKYNTAENSSERMTMIFEAKDIGKRMLAVYTFNDECKVSIQEQVYLLNQFYDNVDKYASKEGDRK